MKISFIRGAYLNNFEGQNFDLPITGYSSLSPLDGHVSFPVVKLASLADLQRIPFLEKPIKYITNRILGDAQILFGLESNIINSDIVHVADPHYFYSYQAAVLKSQGKIRKLISTWWETIPFNNEGTAAKKRIKKYTMSQVDKFICYTNTAKKCILQEGVSEDNVIVIPLGVDLKRFAPKMKTVPSFKILFVGRLVEEKGILDVYKAFKEVVKVYNHVNLQIVGSGPLEGILSKMITQDTMRERVSIEKRNYSEMPEVYMGADVLCIPSKKTNTWEEQLGMVFIEGMASGLPIVSYDTGAIAEVVGNAGICVEENDIKELITMIIRIIEVRELREKLGTMGRDRAEKHFDAKKTKEMIFKLYKSLLTKPYTLTPNP